MLSRDKNQEKDKEKSRSSRFGEIKTSIFIYITPLMIFIAGVVVLICYYNIQSLMMYFNTNIYLNGLIIFLAFLALFKAFYYNFRLYTTAVYLKRVEKVAERGEASDADIDYLHRNIRTKAYLIDTQNFHDAIENIRTFGHMNFTDNDARLIKHKLGYRIGLRRVDVGFMAGILVMLGLLGTFLGLLKTIDAVGEAMGTMSNITGPDGEIDEAAVNSFMGGLSEPLQGMGLAFSSSLFGLSGSLMIGFFNHMCGGAQDKFIENVGRWIDDRIPRFTPSDDVEPKGKGLATEDDLKSWLAGFVYMSVKTNKKLGLLTSNLIEHIKKSHYSNELLTKIEQHQNKLNHDIITLNTAVSKHTSDTHNNLTVISNTLQSHKEDSLNHHNNVRGHCDHIAKSVDQYYPQIVESNEDVKNNLRALRIKLKNSSDENNVFYQRLLETLQEQNQKYDSVFSVTDNQAKDFANVSNNLNGRLSEISNLIASNNEIMAKTNQVLSSETSSRTEILQTTGTLDAMMLEINNLINKIDNLDKDNLSEIIGVNFNSDENES